MLNLAIARDIEYPVPYELRYCDNVHESFRRGRFDFGKARTSRTLAAQVFEARERGVALVGPPADRMFAHVPWYAYIDSLHAGLDRAQEDVDANPSSAALNACRVLHGTLNKRMSAVNKDEAAMWALQAVPEHYQSAIRDALLVYRGVKSHEDVVFAQGEIAAFRDYVARRSQSAFDRAADTGD